jgi:hypothetical protein
MLVIAQLNERKANGWYAFFRFFLNNGNCRTDTVWHWSSCIETRFGDIGSFLMVFRLSIPHSLVPIPTCFFTLGKCQGLLLRRQGISNCWVRPFSASLDWALPAAT